MSGYSNCLQGPVNSLQRIVCPVARRNTLEQQVLSSQGEICSPMTHHADIIASANLRWTCSREMMSFTKCGRQIREEYVRLDLTKVM